MSACPKQIHSMSADSNPSVPVQRGPVFRVLPVRLADTGKVRLGAQGPVFRADAIKDTGKVRLGAQGPIFR